MGSAPPSSPLPSSCKKNTQSSQQPEMHTTQANIAAFFNADALATSGNAADEAKAHRFGIASTTPIKSQRNLMRNDTPIDPNLHGTSQPNSNVLDKFKLSEITVAVSTVFREAGEGVLAKQTLENAVAKKNMNTSPEIFAQALVQLDK